MTVERVVMFCLLWLTCFVILPVQIASAPNAFQPEGPDAFMRLERVNLLVETGDWYDGHIARAAGEGGADIHWTRPMDLLIIGAAAPIMPFMSTHDAIETAGVVLPALMSLLLVLVCIWAVIPLMQPGNLFSIIILLAVQPVIQNYFHIGRADHHMVLAVLTGAVLGCMIRLNAHYGLSRDAFIGGMLSGLGLWISLEFLIVFVPVTLGVGLCWLIWGKEWRRVNRDFAMGTVLVCLAAMATDVMPESWLIAHYDRISIAQLFLVVCPFFFWSVIAEICDRRGQTIGRITGAGVFAIVCLSLILFYFPDLLVGPVAEADPRIGPIWHDKVSEMLPLLGNTRMIILNCLLPFIAIVYGCFVLFGRKHLERRQMWMRLLPVLICTGALALFHMRASLYLAVVGVIAAGPLLEYSLSRVASHYSGWRKSATGLLVRAAIILGPFFLAVLVGTVSNGLKPSEAIAAVKPTAAKCKAAEIATFLSDDGFIRGRGVLKFANNLDYGPELIYRTPHHFLAVPYHRNGDSIFDTHALLTAKEYSKSDKILRKYDIDYILICPDDSSQSYFQESNSQEVLYNRLLAGSFPDNLTEIDVPSPWRLFEVRNGKE